MGRALGETERHRVERRDGSVWTNAWEELSEPVRARLRRLDEDGLFRCWVFLIENDPNPRLRTHYLAQVRWEHPDSAEVCEEYGASRKSADAAALHAVQHAAREQARREVLGAVDGWG